MFKIILFWSTFILLFPGYTSLAFAGGEPEPFNLKQVADGIYLHTGVHVEFADPLHDDIANIGFIVGNNCIAVIDTGGSVAIGQELLFLLERLVVYPSVTSLIHMFTLIIS